MDINISAVSHTASMIGFILAEDRCIEDTFCDLDDSGKNLEWIIGFPNGVQVSILVALENPDHIVLAHCDYQSDDGVYHEVTLEESPFLRHLVLALLGASKRVSFTHDDCDTISKRAAILERFEQRRAAEIKEMH